MASILISGPAGANKSALARQLLEEHPELAVIADFQLVYRALTDVERGRNGRYPTRDRRLLPITEFVRQSILLAAADREIDVIMTNSDSSPERRSELLRRLGPGATERVIDPGREIVEARLSDFNPATGELRLSDECGQAISRWYR